MCSVRVELPLKTCKVCKRLYGRSRFKSGRLESIKDYESREHCCRSCAHTKDVVTDRAYYYRAQKFKKDKCDVCGSTHKLVVHHNDQCIDHNTEENCPTLCKYGCHKPWHEYCSRMDIFPAGFPDKSILDSITPF